MPSSFICPLLFRMRLFRSFSFFWLFCFFRLFRLSDFFGRRRFVGGSVVCRLFIPFHGGDKLSRKLAFAAMQDIEIADDGKRERAEKVEDQVLHGIDHADVEKTAVDDGDDIARFVKEYGLCDVLHGDDDVLAALVQQNAPHGVDQKIFLHIQFADVVHKKFKKFPQHPHGHGKTERHNGEKEGGKGKLAPAAVEKVGQSEPDGRAQEPVDKVQKTVPKGKVYIKRRRLAQHFRTENEQQDNDFQRCRYLDAEGFFDEKGQKGQKQCQCAEYRRFGPSAREGKEKCRKHRRLQAEPDDEGSLMRLYAPEKPFQEKRLFLYRCFPFVLSVFAVFHIPCSISRLRGDYVSVCIWSFLCKYNFMNLLKAPSRRSSSGGQGLVLFYGLRRTFASGGNIREGYFDGCL